MTSTKYSSKLELIKVKGNTKMYNIDQVAEMLRLCRITVFRYIKSGKIKAIKIGREWRIKQEEIDRIMREGL